MQLYSSLQNTKQKLVQLEKILASVSLLTLLCLSLFQVILRNFFELGFSDIDVISRHLVLFVTFMGAALVSENNHHIKIDCVTSVIDPGTRQRLKVPLLIISTMVCAILSWYAGVFWLDEKQYAPDNEQLALYMALIIPFGFIVLSVHFLLLTLSEQFSQLGHGDNT